jgi:hypothetical protein
MAGRPDPITMSYTDAVSHLDRAVRHLDALFGTMAAVAVVERSPRSTPCEVCKAAGLANPEEAAHFGSVGGRLTREAALCDIDYGFTWRAGRLPTAEERAHHDRTGRWRTRVV